MVEKLNKHLKKGEVLTFSSITKSPKYVEAKGGFLL